MHIKSIDYDYEHDQEHDLTADFRIKVYSFKLIHCLKNSNLTIRSIPNDTIKHILRVGYYLSKKELLKQRNLLQDFTSHLFIDPSDPAANTC